MSTSLSLPRDGPLTKWRRHLKHPRGQLVRDLHAQQRVERRVNPSAKDQERAKEMAEFNEKYGGGAAAPAADSNGYHDRDRDGGRDWDRDRDRDRDRRGGGSRRDYDDRGSRRDYSDDRRRY